MSSRSTPQPRLSDAQVQTLTEPFPGARTAKNNDMVRQMHWALLAMARRQMAQERPGHTLSPNALLNEAWVRLQDGFPEAPQDRNMFMAIAARLMRQVLVDHARARNREKRGGAMTLDTYTESLDVSRQQDFLELLDMEQLLEALEAMNPTHCRIVECRFFAGMNITETADALGLSVSTVNRGWRMARAWLQARLDEQGMGVQ